MQSTCKHICVICELEERAYVEFRAKLDRGFAMPAPEVPSEPVTTIGKRRRGGRGHGLDDSERARIKDLAGQGVSQSGIATALGLSRTTIGRVLGTIPQYRPISSHK